MATQDNTSTEAVFSYPVESASNSFTFAGESSGEIIQMIAVKKGWKIVEVILQSDDLGTAVTLTVGDGGDPNRFVVAVNTDSGIYARLDNAVGINYEYTADDTIDLVTGSAAATGVCELTVLYQRTFD